MKNKLLRSLVLSCFLVLMSNVSQGQCNIVSGSSGSIQNATQTTTVNYTVAVTGATTMANLGSFTSCGFTFPAISAPWSNNSNALGTAVYTFSVPLYSVDVFVAYVGVTGATQPETFTFTTNGAVPGLTINSGSCPGWVTVGNVTSSPSVVGAWNVLTTVTSTVAFTTLTIESGLNSNVNGGSSYGLCSTSAVLTGACSLASPTITASKPSFCPNDSSVICAPSGFTTYQWNSGESTTCLAAYNTDSFYVTVTDNNGCTAVSNHLGVTKNPLPADTAYVAQSIFCSGDSTLVCATNITPGYTHFWSTGDSTVCFYTTHAGNYWVTTTDTNGCSAISNHLAINIYPIPPVSISVNGNTLSAFNAVSYQWYLNNTVLVGANDSVYVAQQSGNYSLEITDVNGCHITSNPLSVVVSGIASISSEQSLSLFPNPATNYVSITFDESMIGSNLTMTDVTGREVLHSVVQIRNPSAIQNFSPGVYFVTLENENGRVTKKLLKQ